MQRLIVRRDHDFPRVFVHLDEIPRRSHLISPAHFFHHFRGQLVSPSLVVFPLLDVLARPLAALPAVEHVGGVLVKVGREIELGSQEDGSDADAQILPLEDNGARFAQVGIFGGTGGRQTILGRGVIRGGRVVIVVLVLLLIAAVACATTGAGGGIQLGALVAAPFVFVAARRLPLIPVPARA